jgi:hypothetical protein
MENKLLFVGEERSDKAKQMGVRWEDGRLAAKQLFDALEPLNINPRKCTFCNYFEDSKRVIKTWKGFIIGMGRKVQRALTKDGIEHIPIIHPAARGKIRSKRKYQQHIKTQLCNISRDPK